MKVETSMRRKEKRERERRKGRWPFPPQALPIGMFDGIAIRTPEENRPSVPVDDQNWPLYNLFHRSQYLSLTDVGNKAVLG